MPLELVTADRPGKSLSLSGGRSPSPDDGMSRNRILRKR
uniref:Uncharacterized protein n=1 Tax=Siphoviridae sp. ctGa111 TaxID=2825413 RepID=A0A8S5VD99_9CAUD|nr:MAG TPA: hypothetical protein [Siphoviridae sp. ctGa111]DAT26385.1 MAG TPA: hypothetical protein [Bacteriophage sp.]